MSAHVCEQDFAEKASETKLDVFARHHKKLKFNFRQSPLRNEYVRGGILWFLTVLFLTEVYLWRVGVLIN